MQVWDEYSFILPIDINKKNELSQDIIVQWYIMMWKKVSMYRLSYTYYAYIQSAIQMSNMIMTNLEKHYPVFPDGSEAKETC